jgi:hypothetical protein
MPIRREGQQREISKMDHMGKVFIAAFCVVIILAAIIVVWLHEPLRRRAVSRKYKHSNPQLRQDIIDRIIRVGMNEEQVIDALGTPAHRTASQPKTRAKTILSFIGGNRVYLKNGRVSGWHKSTWR